MIVSASYRSDIPALYGAWFAKRLDAGFALVANPYGGKPYRVSLAAPDVDGPGLEGIVFWTRNAAPFRAGFEAVAARGLPFAVQYTVTAYPRTIEPAVPDAARGIADMRALRDRFGPRAVVWRYDPILMSSVTGADWHQENFADLAASLRGATDEVVVSFAQIYAKTRRNLDAAAREHGFTWREPGPDEKRALLSRLAAIAGDNFMRLTLCTQPDLASDATQAARCIDADRLSDIAGRDIAAREKGNRPGCLCAESRDIGAYDSCTQGCAYCYAVTSRAAAQANRRRHDPADEMLVPQNDRKKSTAA
jgi:hypothetical protein